MKTGAIHLEMRPQSTVFRRGEACLARPSLEMPVAHRPTVRLP